MHAMEEQFNEKNCIETILILSGDKNLSEMRYSDTLNYYLERLSLNCLSQMRKKLIKKLVCMESFQRGKLLGQYWWVILDGTGLFYFKEKNCENCLSQMIALEDGTKVKTYYHKVLEAKLVLSEKVVVSLDTEFIENEKEDVSKQDCEIEAVKRLLKSLAKDYPKLLACIQGDNLYEAESLMKI